MADTHSANLIDPSVAGGTTLNTQADVGSVDFVDPNIAGGSMLNRAGSGGGEPLNVIISALSSPDVLIDAGFLNYARSIGFSTEFLGIHIGSPQPANLGDGHGWVNETLEIRQDFDDVAIGTLEEVLLGGNHFRMYRQNGPTANTGALFLAVSQEMNVTQSHNLVANGYNIGRDRLVAKAIGNPNFQGLELVATAIGNTSFQGVNYTTTLKRLTGLLSPGAQGVNHGIPTDGNTALLTVKID